MLRVQGGVVYKDGCDFVIKETTMSNGMIAHEANMCNEYNLKSGGTGNIATVTGNHIRMPFLSGKEPSEENVIDGVKALYDKGFMIADACPSNFLRCQSGEIVPIDFGLVFKRDELDSIDSQVKIEIVRDYIKGGCEYIPSELKTEYISCISKLYQCLGDQSSSIDVNVRELRKAGLLSPMKFNK